MAIDEFWRNLTNAAGYYASTVKTDSAHLDPDSRKRMLREAVMWLTPRSVEGFRVEEFGFLEKEKRTELHQSVEQFLDIAKQVRGKKRQNSSKLTRRGLLSVRSWVCSR